VPRAAAHLPPSRPLDADEAERLAEIMSAFGTASRVRLLFALYGVERSVEELADATDLPARAVSQQLRVLRLFRLVKSRRDGRHIRYRLADDHVADLLAAIRAHGDHAAGLEPAAGAATSARPPRPPRALD
jgi:ArsR family transcriptional regulator, lead/cadmium/zinc/bismuth-responsive transcriptional repressor